MITAPLNAQVIAGWRTVAYNSTASRAFTAASRRPMTLLDFFKQVPLFAGLPDSELEVLVKDFVMRHFEQGEAIFHQGDSGRWDDRGIRIRRFQRPVQRRYRLL